MSDDYIAAVGAGAAALKRQLCTNNPTFRIVIDRPQLVLLARPDAALAKLAGDCGALVGTVFDDAWREPLMQIDEVQSGAAARSGGASLIENLWGAYVAFVIDDDNEVAVVRDPSGAMQCYHAEIDATHLFAARVASLCGQGLIEPSLNWRFVAQHLLWPERRNSVTGLTGIAELVAGERARTVRGMLQRDLVWDPWHFAASDNAFDEAQAAEPIRRAVQNSVSAWQRRYARPLVSLSGGLDSSIIMACLRDKAAAAVTFLTDEPLGDERHYASAVAAQYGVPLIARRLDIANIDPTQSHAATLPRPVSRLFAQELDHIWRDTVSETGTDALFHGGGGDNVFCFLASATPYLDSLIMRGLGSATRRTLLDLSRMTKVSTWRLRYAALRKFALHRGGYRWFRDPLFLTRDAIAVAEDAEQHPWFAAQCGNALPGKRAHVAAIIRVQNYLEAVEPSGATPIVAPLTSQPVLEACLRIPTWAWCAGGNNRAVARRAFAKELPPVILTRTSKGSPDAFDAQCIADHRTSIRALLLDGLLASHGLIAREAVEAALAGTGPMRGTAYLRISELVNVEAWAQSWTGRRRSGGNRQPRSRKARHRPSST